MTTGKQLAGLFLLTTALTCPGVAFAQGTAGDANAGIPGSQPTQQGPDVVEEEAALQQVESVVEPPAEETPQEAEISVPGGEIIVTGRINRDPVRNASQVLSVLSSEQIARTGEGDIAGALSRVTGLSVQSNGFVFVRGLGDRYSLALLNGLPLPSPEPLSRVIPLDIFPTNVIASSLVQKTYSVNYPGEFGGGVINLTTRAVPEESFITIGGGISGDTESTGQAGYSYFGSGIDWTGFDNGARDTPEALQNFFESGQQINLVDRATERELIKALTVPSFMTLQKLDELPVNFSGSITAGTGIDVFSDGRFGVIATAAISNRWRNRVITSQFADDPDLALRSDFTNWTTDNRILVNALLGFGLEVADHRFRFTNLYIRDTLKQSVLGIGFDFNDGRNIADQETAWFERQLFDTQFVGEMEFGDLGVDLRAGYAQTQREVPFEYDFRYFNDPEDPVYGAQGLYQNRLGGQTDSASVAFSDLTEDAYHGGIDVSYPVLDWATAVVGYAYSKTDRYSSRRVFDFRSSNLPVEFSLFQPRYLLSDAIIDFGEDPANRDPYEIGLVETTQATPAFIADLEIHGAYGQLRLEPVPGMMVDAGVRYEEATQSVRPDTSVFAEPGAILDAQTSLENDYLLPAVTLTYEFGGDLQGRLSAAKTIARPQFRELIFQPYEDPEANRLFIGNPLLQDSELSNYEARLEYFPGGGTRALLAGFYKEIERPIEAFSTFGDGRVQTSFANAPKAQLYGAELELEYRYDLFDLGNWFETKEVLLVANYTYTQSEIQVQEGDQTAVFGSSVTDASLYFDDGYPLTGQSDHLVNLQASLEDTERLQQLTFLFSYASERVISRGFNQLPPIVEDPGMRFDLVARQGFDLGGTEAELKLEARNIFGEDHEEFQHNGTDRIEINSYDVGTTFAASLSVTF